MRLFTLFITVLSIININSLSAQTSKINISKVNERIYKLSYNRSTYSTNMIVSVGEDGILLVDAGQIEEADDLKEAILSFDKGLPKYIINTHEHIDHIGGNSVFGESPIIVGHKILRERLKTSNYITEDIPDYALPEIGIVDSLSIFFNGEEIKIISMPSSHSDNDIIVWFTKSNIVCIGDIAYKEHFPSYDVSGSLLNYPKVTKQVISLFPDDAIYIPGHYDNMTKNDIINFNKMTENSIEIIKSELEIKSYEKINADSVLAKWNNYSKGYINLNAWASGLVYFIQPDAFDPIQESIVSPVFSEYKKNGFDAAIQLYNTIMSETPDDYMILDGDLWFIGSRLYTRKNYLEAITFFEYDIKVKDSEDPTNSLLYLGKSYMQMGNYKLAKNYLKKAQKESPENEQVKKALLDLESLKSQ